MQSFQTTGVKHLDVSDTGALIKIVFDSRQGEVAFEFPVKAYATLLPMLVRAKALADQKKGPAYASAVFTVEEITIVGNQGGLLLGLQLPEGADFAFQLDTESARRLVAELQRVLEQSGGSSPGAAH